jgi:hypothetical protein
MGYSNISSYYTTNFTFKTEHNFSFDEIYNMYPFERDIYIAMINQKAEKKAKDNYG